MKHPRSTCRIILLALERAAPGELRPGWKARHLGNAREVLADLDNGWEPTKIQLRRLDIATRKVVRLYPGLRYAFGR